MSNPYRPRRLPWRTSQVQRVQVTEDHIGAGIPCDGEDCAVSLAVAEHFTKMFPGTRWEVSTTSVGVKVYECDSGTDMWTYIHDAHDFINRFDALADTPGAEIPGSCVVTLRP